MVTSTSRSRNRAALLSLGKRRNLRALRWVDEGERDSRAGRSPRSSSNCCSLLLNMLVKDWKGESRDQRSNTTKQTTKDETPEHRPRER